MHFSIVATAVTLAISQATLKVAGALPPSIAKDPDAHMSVQAAPVGEPALQTTHVPDPEAIPASPEASPAGSLNHTSNGLPSQPLIGAPGSRDGPGGLENQPHLILGDMSSGKCMCHASLPPTCPSVHDLSSPPFLDHPLNATGNGPPPPPVQEGPSSNGQFPPPTVQDPTSVGPDDGNGTMSAATNIVGQGVSFTGMVAMAVAAIFY